LVEAKLLKSTRWVLMLLALGLAPGCGHVLEVGVVTNTATPALFTPRLTPGITQEATPAQTPPPTVIVVTPSDTPISQPTSIPTLTSLPLTATPQPPTPTLEPGPTRIRFEPGATSATVAGHIGQNGIDRYVLRALAGQTMEVRITSPDNNVLLDIWGADGTVLKRHAVGEAYWAGVLPATQDYFIGAVSVGGETNYLLTVTISALEPAPTRIQFSPGATSAAIQASLEPGIPDRYVLRALQGQSMEIRVSSSASIDIAMQGQDGSFWSAPGPGGVLSIEALPATQDYIITLALPAPVTEAVSYTVEVSVSPL
jgi:hypothetical protein